MQLVHPAALPGANLLPDPKQFV